MWLDSLSETRVCGFFGAEVGIHPGASSLLKHAKALLIMLLAVQLAKEGAVCIKGLIILTSEMQVDVSTWPVECLM